MKNLIFIFSLLLLVSCGSNTIEEPTTKRDFDKEVLEEKPFSNPMLIYGSDFGNFFKVLYAQGKFDEMLKFTSKTSIEKFGKDSILDFYKNDLKFGYEIGKPHSQINSGDTITLNYNANIIATKRVVRISLLVENDTCKVVLPNNLNDFLK